MSPQQLLRETQRAAGDENLTNWHDTLISAGKELKQMLQVDIPFAKHDLGYLFLPSPSKKSTINSGRWWNVTRALNEMFNGTWSARRSNTRLLLSRIHQPLYAKPSVRRLNSLKFLSRFKTIVSCAPNTLRPKPSSVSFTRRS